MLALVYRDLYDQPNGKIFARYARGTMMERPGFRRRAEADVNAEIQKAEGNWEPLHSGLFDASIERVIAAQKSIHKDVWPLWPNGQ